MSSQASARNNVTLQTLESKPYENLFPETQTNQIEKLERKVKPQFKQAVLDFDMNIIPQFSSILQLNMPNLTSIKQNKNNSSAKEEKKKGAPFKLPSLLTEIDGLNVVKDVVAEVPMNFKQTVRSILQKKKMTLERVDNVNTQVYLLKLQNHTIKRENSSEQSQLTLLLTQVNLMN